MDYVSIMFKTSIFFEQNINIDIISIFFSTLSSLLINTYSVFIFQTQTIFMSKDESSQLGLARLSNFFFNTALSTDNLSKHYLRI